MGNRDEIWNSAWETFYDSYYYSILFSLISKRWQLVDFYTRLIVAMTASGSAIAGWALWNDDDFKILWIILAGFASIISIIHSTLNINEKIKHYTLLNNNMSNVQLEFESFRQEMRVYPEFHINDFFNKHTELREKYQKALELNTPDLLSTDYMQNKAQGILNTKLNIKGEK